MDDWDELPGTNNPVESINRQSTPTNVKSVSLKPLYLNIFTWRIIGKQHCKLQLRQELQFHIGPTNREEHVVLQKHQKADWLLYPLVKNLLDLRVSIEFYENDQQTTHWYKGTVISYSRKGYIIIFDGCGPGEDEVVKSLKQGVEKGEIKLL